MNVTKLHPVLGDLLGAEGWALVENTPTRLAYRAHQPTPGAYDLVEARATATGFELRADGDVFQDLRDDLQRLYGRAEWVIDMNTYVGIATFRCQ